MRGSMRLIADDAFKTYWRMAVPQVSPSMPTHADPEPALVGEGTVKVPVTEVNLFGQLEQAAKRKDFLKLTQCRSR